MWASIVFLGFLSLAFAQNCENYGVANGSSCTCPTGFGGPTCSEIACGGSLFEGSQRPLTSTQSGFANLTAEDCSCPSGWGGFGCNVCQSDDACQSTSSDLSAPDSSVPGMNRTIVCNKSSRVFASSQMSCSVDVRLSHLFIFGQPHDYFRILHYAPSFLDQPTLTLSVPSTLRSLHYQIQPRSALQVQLTPQYSITA